MQPRLHRVRARDARVALGVVRVEREDVLAPRRHGQLLLLGRAAPTPAPAVAAVAPGKAEADAQERAVGEPLQAECALEAVCERAAAWRSWRDVALRVENPALPALDAPEAEEGGEQHEPACAGELAGDMRERRREGHAPTVMRRKESHSEVASLRRKGVLSSGTIGLGMSGAVVFMFL